MQTVISCSNRYRIPFFTFISHLIIPLLLFTLIHPHRSHAQIYSLERKFYVAGDFNRIYNSNNSLIAANNIAMWNGKWNKIGSGTNGPITNLLIDNCYNLYVGGSFTATGYNITTGPVARMRPNGVDWEPIYSTATNWTSGSIVNAVASECYNRGPTFAECTCDVYIGGKFEFKDLTTGLVYQNFAKWDITNMRWDPTVTNLTSEVTSIVKKDYGMVEAVNAALVGMKNEGFKVYNYRKRP